MNRHYLYIKQARKTNESISQHMFSTIWDDIIEVSVSVYRNVFASFIRFRDIE